MMTMIRSACGSLLAMATAVALTACGSVRYPAHYVLEIPAASPAPARSPGALGPLAMRELGSPAYLSEGRVVYREGPNRVGFYDYHRWAVEPRVALTDLFADRIRASSLFESVTVAGSPARAAYLLRGDIERFEELDEETSVHAICTVSAEVIEIKTGAVQWRGSVTERVPVQKRDMAAVVAGLGQASGTVADRLVASMANELAPSRLP